MKFKKSIKIINKSANRTKRVLILSTLLLLLNNNLNVNATEIDESELEKSNYLIIDTDYASDADDVVALEIATAFDKDKLVDIKGVCLSTTYSRSVPAVYKHLADKKIWDVPVGMNTITGLHVNTKYVDVMYEGGRTDYMQCKDLYRKILAESDKKVNIITLGFTQNIEDLLKSQPDVYSPLNGVDLVKEKVDTLYIVGGNNDNRPSFNYWYGKDRDTIGAAQYVVNNFPSRIVFFQEEMGKGIWCASFYNSEDKKEKNLVTKALKANNQQNGLTCDPFAIYCAVQDMNNNLEESFLGLECGTQYISSTGASLWIPDFTENNLRQRFKKLNDINIYNSYYSNMIDTKLREVMNK